MKADVRFLKVNRGQIWLNRDDVVTLINEAAAAEDTDTRNRWQLIAARLALTGNPGDKSFPWLY